MVKMATKKKIMAKEPQKQELTKEQEARFNKEFDKYYNEKLAELRARHGDKAGGMYFRWFDEEMYHVRQMKKKQFIEQEKLKDCAGQKEADNQK